MQISNRVRTNCHVLGAMASRLFWLALLGLFVYQVAGAQEHYDPSITHQDYVENNRFGIILKQLPEPGNAPEASGDVGTLRTKVAYQGFGGVTYELLKAEGKYVQVLYPEEWPDGIGLTDALLAELVDQLDMLWSLFVEVLGAEPGGSGLSIVAFVEDAGPTGARAKLGSRGIEMSDGAETLAFLKAELDAGTLFWVLVHEFSHNFDLYSNYFRYLSDHGHAWTAFSDVFVQHAFGRMGNFEHHPDTWYQVLVSWPWIWQAHLANPDSTWDSCVVAEGCEDVGLPANQLWASLYHRIFQLYGSEAILHSFRWMNDYVKSNGVPASKEGKESLRANSLAYGADANIACFLRMMRFPVSEASESQWMTAYGSQNPLCEDTDGDGYSAFEGDCDDSDASTGPSGQESPADLRDNDCDRLVDEVDLSEEQTGDLPSLQQPASYTSLPFVLTGEIADDLDEDTIGFPVPPSGYFAVRLCSLEGFKGWATPVTQQYQWLDVPIHTVSIQLEGRCWTVSFVSSEQYLRLWMRDSGGLGRYEITAVPSPEWLSDVSSGIKVTQNPAGGMNVQFEEPVPPLDTSEFPEVDLWISGIGIVDSRPLSPSSAPSTSQPGRRSVVFRLDGSTSPSLESDSLYRTRVRLRKGHEIIQRFSGPYLFQYDGRTRALPVIDDSFSGSWYDPTHNGEGFIVQVLEDNRALVYWFTYSFDGDQRWLLGTGRIAENRIEIDDLLSTRGGRFGSGFNPNDVRHSIDGSLSITFLDCDSAIVNYSVTGLPYSIGQAGANQKLTRLTSLNGHHCSGASSNSTVTDLSGSWFDPSHDGEGFVVEILDADSALVYWFTYNLVGDQSWFLGTGTISETSIRFDELLWPVFGAFGLSFDPSMVVMDRWGSLALHIDCDGGTATYRFTPWGVSNQSQKLQPLARIANSSCD